MTAPGALRRALATGVMVLVYLVAMIVIWESFHNPDNGRWDRLILGGLLVFGVPNGLYLLYLCYQYVRTGE